MSHKSQKINIAKNNNRIRGDFNKTIPISISTALPTSWELFFSPSSSISYWDNPQVDPTKNQRSIQFIAFDAGCLDLQSDFCDQQKIGMCTVRFQFDIGVEQQTELDGLLDVPFLHNKRTRFLKSRIMAILEGQSNSTETGADLPTPQKNNWFTARSCIFQYHRLTVFAMGSSGTLRKHFSTLQHLRGNGQLGEETEQNWQERIAISTRCDRSFLIGGKNASSNCIDLDITYHCRNKWMRKYIIVVVHTKKY